MGFPYFDIDFRGFEMESLHLKKLWFNIRSAEINIKNTEIQRLHFKRVKSPWKSRNIYGIHK